MNDKSTSDAATKAGDAKIRLLVIDDHTLFRRGLTALLARDPQLVVVGDAADAGVRTMPVVVVLQLCRA